MPRGHPALDARSESHIVRGLSMALPYGYPKIPSASLLPQPIDDVTSIEAYGGPNAEAGDASRLSRQIGVRGCDRCAGEPFAISALRSERWQRTERRGTAPSGRPHSVSAQGRHAQGIPRRTPYARACAPEACFFSSTTSPPTPVPCSPSKNLVGWPDGIRSRRSEMGQFFSKSTESEPHYTTLAIVLNTLQASILTSWTGSINRV